MALSADGSLFTWGWGADGRLGHMQYAGLQMMQANEQAMVLDRPRRIDALDPMGLYPWQRATAISSGQHHCMVVTVGGGLVGFGRNKHGQLGLASGERVWTPTAVPLGWHDDGPEHFRAAQVACGAAHTLALVMHRGKPVPCATGANVFGQLGQGNQVARSRFVPIHALAGADIAALQAGDHSSAAIAADGKVYVWGRCARVFVVVLWERA
jgi:alpha-tubulin suppressor-like RCC1 family protein